MCDYSRRYYAMFKDRFKQQYIEKKAREALAPDIPINYYYNYYKHINKWNKEGKDISQEAQNLCHIEDLPD